jgi:hypothetical protein
MGELDDLARASAEVETEAESAGDPSPRRPYAKPRRSNDAALWAIVVAAAVGVIAIIATIVVMNQQPINNVEMKHPDAGVGGPTFFGVGGDKK